MDGGDALHDIEYSSLMVPIADSNTRGVCGGGGGGGMFFCGRSRRDSLRIVRSLLAARRIARNASQARAHLCDSVTPKFFIQ